MDEARVVERLKEVDPLVPGEELAHRALDVRVQVHGIRDLEIRMSVREGPDRAADLADGLAEVLAPMCRQQDEARGAAYERRARARPGRDPLHRVDHRVPGEEDRPLGVGALATEVLRRAGRRREVELRDLAHDAPHELLGEWARADARSQARLDVPDRRAAEERGEARGHRGRRVALHDDDVRPLLVDDPRDRPHGRRRDVFGPLVRLHEVEIVIGRDLEDAQDLVEHLAMLGGRADHRPRVGATPQLHDEWRELDRLRARSEDDERLQDERDPSRSGESSSTTGPFAAGAYSGTRSWSPATMVCARELSPSAASRAIRARRSGAPAPFRRTRRIASCEVGSGRSAAK